MDSSWMGKQTSPYQVDNAEISDSCGQSQPFNVASATRSHLLRVQAGERVSTAHAGGRQEWEPAAVLLRHERQLLLQPRVLLGQSLRACVVHNRVRQSWMYARQRSCYQDTCSQSVDTS